MTDRNGNQLAAALEWTSAMGADAAVAEEPTDWLADGRAPPGHSFDWAKAQEETGSVPVRPATPVQPERSVPPLTVASPLAALPAAAKPARTPAAVPAPAARKFAPAPPDVAVAAARAAARKCANLDELRKALEAFDACGLNATAKNLCFYRGAAQAPVMILGDVPGRDEDMEGRPIAGAAGQLLDRMVAAAGWSETDVHIAGAVYWRPPGNRSPTPPEAEVCRPFLERQIELVQPRVLMLMGGAATKQIVRSDEGILKIRGQWQTLTFGHLKVATIITLPPGYLLKTPIAKQHAWRDLLSVNEALKAAQKSR